MPLYSIQSFIDKGLAYILITLQEFLHCVTLSASALEVRH